MTILTRIAMLPFAALIVSASPGPIVLPHPQGEHEALVIPPASPVKFRRWDKSSGYAQLDGRFVLTGKFTYGCGSNCADYEGPVAESDLLIAIEPDPELVARLPHWKTRQQDVLILITGEKELARAIATRRQHAALRAGKIQELNGRIAIVVDDFQTGLECDSAHFRARFVAIAKAPKLANVEFSGAYGCGP